MTPCRVMRPPPPCASSRRRLSPPPLHPPPPRTTVVHCLTTSDRPTLTIRSSLSLTSYDQPTLTNRCLSLPDRQVSHFHLSISQRSGVDLGLWVVGLWVLLIGVWGFVADWCTDLWRICGFVRFVDLGLWRIGTLIYGRFVGYDSKGWVWENGGIWRTVEIGGFPSWIWFCVLMDLWVSNLEIGVDFVNKEDAGLLILVGVCWVKISEYANLFLGLIVGVCWFLGFQFWWVYVDFWILVGVCWLLFDVSFGFWFVWL